MIESGISRLVQTDTVVAGLCPRGGGFLVQLPKDQPLPSWSFAFVADIPNRIFTGRSALRGRLLQVDCYGATAAEAVTLGEAVDQVLDTYQGILADSDATIVDGCLRNNVLDFFDSNRESYRRSIEYTIWFYQ